MRTTLAIVELPNSTLRLVHRSAGIEPAGSGSRQVGEAWGALTTSRRDGMVYGQWFYTESEARVRFESVRIANLT